MKVHIIVEPPGKNAKKIIKKDEKYICTTTKTSPIVAKSAKGVYVEDVDGNIYLDFTSGIGVINTGYCHPKIVKSIKEQVEKLMHFAGTDFYYEVQCDLAEKLAKITPGNFDKKVFFTNSGTESNECALKIARYTTDRKKFIAFLGGFHGRTLGSLALTASKPVHINKFFPLMPGVIHIPYAYCYRCAYKQKYPACDIWCAKILDELYMESILPGDEVAGIFIEPVQGEGGYIVPPKEFLLEIKKICDKHKILFIDDEIQAGFGRTGKLFGIEHFGVVPDIISLAKGMGSGIPIGACVFNAKYDFPVKGAHSNTYGGNLIACVSALATIDVIINEKLLHNAVKLGEYMRKRLYELQEKYDVIGDIRGLGLMNATELVEDRKTKKPAIPLRDKIIEQSYKKGLILLPCGKSTIRYIPPLIIKKDELDVGLEILENVLKECI